MSYIQNINYNYEKYKLDMDNFITECENKVNTNHYTTNNEKNKFKTKIVKYYIVPICYLIYSFIYTKYFKSQMQKEMRINNDLNYDMYKYFFNDGNPIIKKVNVQLYKQFQGINNNKKNVNKNMNNNGKNIINKNSKINNNITKEKTDIIDFLKYIRKDMVDKNNYETKIKETEEIVSNFKNLVLNMNKIYKILSKTTPLLPNNELKKMIDNVLNDYFELKIDSIYMDENSYNKFYDEINTYYQIPIFKKYKKTLINEQEDSLIRNIFLKKI